MLHLNGEPGSQWLENLVKYHQIIQLLILSILSIENILRALLHARGSMDEKKKFKFYLELGEEHNGIAPC